MSEPPFSVVVAGVLELVKLFRGLSNRVDDLRSNHARGRVQVRPPEVAFSEIRRLLGYTHHEVAKIFDILPPPSDLDAVHVLPVLLIRHGELNFGVRM